MTAATCRPKGHPHFHAVAFELQPCPLGGVSTYCQGHLVQIVAFSFWKQVVYSLAAPQLGLEIQDRL